MAAVVESDLTHTDPRELSFWGWGYSDRFPDVAARRKLGRRLRMVLRFGPVGVQSPPRLEDVELPPSRLVPPASLESFCSRDDEARVRHTYGRAYRDIVRGFGGDFAVAPDLVACPNDENDIAAVLDWAGDVGAAVIPFGGGTSVVGGVEPDVGAGFQGTVSLDTRRLNQVLEVDPTSLAARIQAGATGPALEARLAEDGLTLRHFPQSFELSTLGGWLATRAGGHFATVYTHIDDLVESIRTVTPRGIMDSRRLPASGAGPSPDRLMLGSEGTMGVITEAWMRVRPRPRYRGKANVLFSSYEKAVEATRAIAQSGLYPSNCRLLDRRESLLNQVAMGRSHVLLLGFESARHPVGEFLDLALEIATDHGGRCPDGPRHREGDASPPKGSHAAAEWRRAFFDAPYLQSTLVSLGIIADTFETSCTWDRFEALHAAVIRNVRATMKRVCGKGFIGCRFTHVYPDGPAPYFTFLAPGTRGRELEQWSEIKRVASETLLKHGGSITHHHAVGRLHQPWYERQRPELFGSVLKAAKRELDPAGILNPGVLVPASQ